MTKRKVGKGEIYGRLTTVSFVSKSDDPSISKAYWVCVCECGNTNNVVSNLLTSRSKTQCSKCSQKQSGITQRTSRHKASRKAYTAWSNMKNRCTNENYHLYHRYGGRGIGVCDNWMLFDKFYLDMGEPPTKHHSIDRINNELGYSKENCRWADSITQANNMCSNVFLEYNGKRQTISEWSEELGISYETIRQRIKRGGDIEKVLSRSNSNPRYKYITPNGEFNKISEVCDSHSIPKTTAHNRFNSQKNKQWVKINQTIKELS